MNDEARKWSVESKRNPASTRVKARVRAKEGLGLNLGLGCRKQDTVIQGASSISVVPKFLEGFRVVEFKAQCYGVLC